MVYATDTRPCPAVRDAARMPTCCAWTPPTPTTPTWQSQTVRPRHLPGDGALAAEAGVRRLWLTHYSAAVTDLEPGLTAARPYPGAVAGTDGMRLQLDFDKED